jgi:mycothiol synthase
MTERPTGVRMLRPDLEGLPPLAPVLAAWPAGYALRTYRPGDEADWATLMNTGDMGYWDAEITREKLTGHPFPQFDPAGLFMATYGPQQTIVGSACAWLVDPAQTELGTLHMVCVLPEHRGLRLSYAVCLAVLHRFRERGVRRVNLSTGTQRKGAVKVYLELGFQPLYQQPWHPELWQELVEALDWRQPLSPVDERGAVAGSGG